MCIKTNEHRTVRDTSFLMLSEHLDNVSEED